MAMVVQHNLTAMNSNRMLGITTGQQAKSSEKLSSGFKINRAADDAAGLTISEKMRKQMRGLDRASTNAQDGISCVQTAEGALTEVHSMLQRMNELAVQASNGTNSEVDRNAIQAEVDQLLTEIDRVSETTKFNETYLLKGGSGTKTRTTTKTTPAQDAVDVKAVFKDAVAKKIDFATGKDDDDINGTNGGEYYLAGSKTAMTKDDFLDALEIGADGKVAFKEGVAIYTAAADDAGEFGGQLEAALVDIADIQAVFEVKNDGLASDNTGTEVTEADLASYFNTDGTYKGGLFKLASDGTTWTEIGAEQIDKFVTVTPGKEAVAEKTETITDTYADALKLSLHVGADSTKENKISIEIETMSAVGIGVNGLKVDTEDSATSSIDTIKAAIQKVSDQRSALGAVQNRLEHTIANLDNVVENTTAAESRIRDTDMAEEMVEYSKNNILAQAGQAMLAQANQSTQGVLSLLQ